MKEIKITTNGDGTLAINPSEAQLGGTHSHQVEWRNETGASVTITSDAWDKIFADPPQSGQLVIGGGGHDGPKPPLRLLPHDQRQNGLFEYGVQGGNQSAQASWNVHP